MDGMPLFIEECWESIKNQRELNVPEKRVMAVDYCCKKSKEEAFRLVEPKLQTLFSQSSEREILDFNSQAVSILDEANIHYTSVAGQYNPEIQGRNRDKLITQIKFHLKQSFHNQLRLKKNTTIKSFKAKITEFEARPLEDIV